ncbi:glycosyltransferase family 4 protein [Vampirovibrio sp.]|uniref:glycosyltransferase family 4 protein n=1 Tax=Vampirovibrio sp. TaxID=2717857 RepID=UPI0035931CF6
MKIAVVLPQDEKMHAYYGGAIARWVAQVYLHRSGDINFTVFSTHFQKKGAYPVPVQGHGFLSRFIQPLLRFPKNDTITLRGLFWMAYLCLTTNHFKGYDAVHIHNQVHYAVWLRKLGYQGKIILHMHNTVQTFLPDRSQWPRLYQSIDMALFCSHFVLRSARNGFEPILPKTAVVYNGVQLSAHNLPPERQALTLLFAGRLVKEKGLLEAMEILAELRKRGIQAILNVAGAAGFATSKITPYMALAQERADAINAHYGAATIRFLGYRSHEALLEEMARSRVFLFPVLWDEPFGMVMVEAMSTGTPVVASRRGGIPEVLQDVGTLVDEMKPSVWADALQPYLQDNAFWEAQSKAALQHVQENFGWPKISADYEGTLRLGLG